MTKYLHQAHQSSNSTAYFPMQQQQKGGPKAPPPPAAIAPPVTKSAVEVQQEKADTSRQNAAKKGFQSTVLAGESGGYGANPNAAKKTTVLGG